MFDLSVVVLSEMYVRRSNLLALCPERKTTGEYWIHSKEESEMRYLIVHKTDGILLGHCLGFAFFSKLDPVGQDEACTFTDVKQATDFLSLFHSIQDGNNKFQDYTFVPVVPSIGNYASVEDCVKAGQEPWSCEYK